MNNGTTLLDIVIPYWYKIPGSNYMGPGGFRLMLTVAGWQALTPTTPWRRAYITITDLELKKKRLLDKDPCKFHELFLTKPFSFVTHDQLTLNVPPPGPDRPQILDRGFVWDNAHYGYWRILCEPNPVMKDWTHRIFDGNAAGHFYKEGMTDITLTVQNPRAEQIQNFLDYVSMLHYEIRVPDSIDWQLQFDVATDLTSVTVASIWNVGRSMPYWRDRRVVLNEGSNVIPPALARWAPKA